MCNISGYIGNKQAAPILIDMMQRQAGYCGGYYTGITTIHEGKLYHAKVIGDVDRLLAETDALNFPGTCGVIHSRSKSGGDWHYAHPFISNNGKLSVVLNGGKVRYEEVCDDDGAAKILYDLGVQFETEAPYNEALKHYPRLPNGNSIHFSEGICHLADHYKQSENLSTGRAIEKAFIRMPSESVCLALHADDGNTISFAKYNMPMTVARTENEVFLSSFSICFPTDREFFVMDQLPSASSGSITLEETKIHRFKPVLPIGNMDPQIVHDGYEIVLKLLKEEGPCSIGKLNKGVRVLWGDLVDLRYPLVYGILQDLQNQGKLEIVKTEREGAAPGLTTVHYDLALK